jgi:adenosylcobinamide-GDP ribazoletransferase
MIRELRLFLVAVQFLTRIPTPHLEDLPADWLARSGKYFPFVGALVGGLSALVLVGAHVVWRSGPLPALLALAASVLLTGALHQDGLADTVDAFGGGRSREQRLAIMKDPRLGTYGALAVGFTVAIKVAALSILPVQLAAAGLVCAHAGARTAAVWTMSFLPYAAEQDASKVDAPHRGLHAWELAVTLAFALALSVLLMRPVAGIACVATAALASSLAARASRARIGGHTGDVLGAVEQIYELFFLLTLCGLSAAGRLVT